MHWFIFYKDKSCFWTIQETCIIYCCYHPACTWYNFIEKKPFSNYISTTWHCAVWTLQTYFNHAHTGTHPFLALCLFLICCNTDLCCANATVTHLYVWAVHRDEINITLILMLLLYMPHFSLNSCHCFCHVFIFQIESADLLDYTLSIDFPPKNKNKIFDKMLGFFYLISCDDTRILTLFFQKTYAMYSSRCAWWLSECQI